VGVFPSASSRKLLLLQVLYAMRRPAFVRWVSVRASRVSICRAMFICWMSPMRLLMLRGVVGGDDNVGGDVLKEIGQSGLGARQFGESEPLEVGLDGPAWVGGFL
jgi:hypothetical protein